MYSFEGRVRYSECGADGLCTLVSAMNYLQDCSTFHSEEVGYGLDWLREEGLGWIIASWQIEVLRLPAFAEEIEISTWSYELKRLHANRCFEIAAAGGEPLVRADSQWFLYDLKAHKVCRVPESQKAYLSDEPRLDMPPMERKLSLEGEGRPASPVCVGPQHLDTNGHVNNAQYVLFALDALQELGIEQGLRRISVQYRNMAWPGGRVYPSVHACEGGHAVALADEAGSPYAIVKIQEA